MIFRSDVYMPIYTYRCRECGKVFEIMKKVGSNGSEVCQYCSAEADRLFTPTGIIFKGSGFYTTDYKSGSSKSNLNTDSKKEEKKDDSSQQKDSKPESPSAKVADTSVKSSGKDVKNEVKT
jgi:putative FmdB family regulatory protein